MQQLFHNYTRMNVHVYPQILSINTQIHNCLAVNKCTIPHTVKIIQASAWQKGLGIPYVHVTKNPGILKYP